MTSNTVPSATPASHVNPVVGERLCVGGTVVGGVSGLAGHAVHFHGKLGSRLSFVMRGCHLARLTVRGDTRRLVRLDARGSHFPQRLQKGR
jgi:hypothetical protein